MQNSKAERAKIFQPFDSLHGFKDYIKSRERVIVKRKNLSEDDCMELDRNIHMVEKGAMIKIVYYEHCEYIEIKGIVSKVDLEYDKMIQVVNTKVRIKDIVEIAL